MTPLDRLDQLQRQATTADEKAADFQKSLRQELGAMIVAVTSRGIMLVKHGTVIYLEPDEAKWTSRQLSSLAIDHDRYSD